MKKKPKFRQCALRRPLEGGGYGETTSYIPEKYAVVGKCVKLKDWRDVWIDGWKILSAGELVDAPPDYRKAIRGHRGNTGDDLPKVEPK